MVCDRVEPSNRSTNQHALLTAHRTEEHMMPVLRDAVGADRLMELGRRFQAAKDHVPTRWVGAGALRSLACVLVVRLSVTVCWGLICSQQQPPTEQCTRPQQPQRASSLLLQPAPLPDPTPTPNPQPHRNPTHPRPHPSAPNSLLVHIATSPIDYIRDRWRFGVNAAA